MAATIPEYVDPLLRRQQTAATLIGSDVLHADVQSYRINLTLLTIIGVMMKALHDKGVVTDAEWLARLDSALAGNWPDWILHQTAPPGQ
jgi:mannitol/fructose-specific phosphotransferase system IIA component